MLNCKEMVRVVSSDELAVATLEGIKAGDFVIMVGREQMEAQLVDRARKLARGECPTALIPTLS